MRLVVRALALDAVGFPGVNPTDNLYHHFSCATPVEMRYGVSLQWQALAKTRIERKIQRYLDEDIDDIKVL